MKRKAQEVVVDPILALASILAGFLLVIPMVWSIEGRSYSLDSPGTLWVVATTWILWLPGTVAYLRPERPWRWAAAPLSGGMAAMLIFLPPILNPLVWFFLGSPNGVFYLTPGLPMVGVAYLGAFLRRARDRRTLQAAASGH